MLHHQERPSVLLTDVEEVARSQRERGIYAEALRIAQRTQRRTARLLKPNDAVGAKVATLWAQLSADLENVFQTAETLAAQDVTTYHDALEDHDFVRVTQEYIDRSSPPAIALLTEGLERLAKQAEANVTAPLINPNLDVTTAADGTVTAITRTRWP